MKGHLARDCRKRAAGEPRKPGPTPRAADAIEQGPPQYADYTEQVHDKSMGSMEREVYCLDMCGNCSCPDSDSELFGECICEECMTLDTERDCDVLEDEDWVLDARGFKEIIVHDDGIDASEIITAAIGLVPPVSQFAHPTTQYGSAEVASHRTEDDRHVETRWPTSLVSAPLVSGAKYFGSNSDEQDPWSGDQDPWTTVERKRKGFPSSSAGPSTASLPPASTASDAGPTFPPPLTASAAPLTYTSGITSFIHTKGVQTADPITEAKQKVLVHRPSFA